MCEMRLDVPDQGYLMFLCLFDALGCFCTNSTKYSLILSVLKGRIERVTPVYM